MKIFTLKWKPLNIIRVTLYIMILYLLVDIYLIRNKQTVKLQDKSTTGTNFESESEVTETTPLYDDDVVTDTDLDDLDFEMVNGEGINNIVAWRELKESEDYIIASTYRRSRSVFEMPGFSYLNNFKSPCWHEKESEETVGTIKCLPYFFLAGVEKCGTTDLYGSLTMHDMIEAGLVKEPHYWSKKRFRKKPELSTYLDNFNAVAKVIHRYMKKNDSTYYHPKITLDGSADTLLFNYIWKTFAAQMLDPEFARSVLTPYHIKHILPKSKFVVILRNPVDRLYSSYNFFPLLIRKPNLYVNVSRKEVAKEMYDSKSPEDFHNKVVDALKWFANCTTHYPGSYKCFFWNNGEDLIDYFVNHMQMGFYGVTLKLWFQVFPMKQFKIIRLEDYSVDTVNVLNGVFDFLGLDAMTSNMTEKIQEKKVSNYGMRQKLHGPMLPETRQLLSEFYRPYNRLLADLLNDSRYLYL